MSTPELRIGTAGWSISASDAEAFPKEGSRLERYASRFNAVEINSSFHRRHRASTYARWASVTPEDFRFSVKLPRIVTHDQQLVGVDNHLEEFRADVTHLSTKLGPILVQIPPSLAFEHVVASDFFLSLRERFTGPIAFEPRHASWFGNEATNLLVSHRIHRVAADPEPVLGVGASEPGADVSLVYFRLHGSPRIYYSGYGEVRLMAIARAILAARASIVWCSLDNTASGAAIGDALTLIRALEAFVRTELPDPCRVATPSQQERKS